MSRIAYVNGRYLPMRDAMVHIEDRGYQFAERALQPFDVTPLVDEAASPHLADFVDAVGELITAILDMDFCRAHRQVAAVDVGYPRHR